MYYCNVINDIMIKNMFGKKKLVSHKKKIWVFLFQKLLLHFICFFIWIFSISSKFFYFFLFFYFLIFLHYVYLIYRVSNKHQDKLNEKVGWGATSQIKKCNLLDTLYMHIHFFQAFPHFIDRIFEFFQNIFTKCLRMGKGFFLKST